MLIAGCASSPGQAQSPAATGSTETQTSPARPQISPADSPLTTCINPTPTKPKPVDTALAQNFANERVQKTFLLDGGNFRAAPPRNARPDISAMLAFCNLLAGATADGFTVVDAAAQHGMSFGLGVVTVSDAVLNTGPQSFVIDGVQRTASLQPYHARLAWIAVIKPDVVSSCPKQPPPSSSPPSERTTPTKRLPGYQILVFDADTGADGIIYQAESNDPCGYPVYRPARLEPAVEFISAPWTLVDRGPGPKSATISYQRRPCDQFPPLRFAGTGQPVVMPERARPALVFVDLARVLTTCGPAVSVNVLLRSATLATDLPAQLVHAPVGARDATQQDVG
jgi:hypothetical protein